MRTRKKREEREKCTDGVRLAEGKERSQCSAWMACLHWTAED
jgi:ribosomal protein S27AE